MTTPLLGPKHNQWTRCRSTCLLMSGSVGRWASSTSFWWKAILHVVWKLEVYLKTSLYGQPDLRPNGMSLCPTNRFIYLFGVLRRFQHCTGHITTGSWKGRGNQYIEFVRDLYCKLPTNSKQLPAFPLEAVPGIEPRPQSWEARVLPLCHRVPPTNRRLKLELVNLCHHGIPTLPRSIVLIAAQPEQQELPQPHLPHVRFHRTI